MRIAVLGTGMVGQTLAAALAGRGHEVSVGTRDPDAAKTRTTSEEPWVPPFGQWHQAHGDIPVRTFSEAAAGGELVINATLGDATLAALEQAGSENLDGKVLIDVTNPLDFSQGMPPSLFVSNTDSLAEQIQRAHPGARVVKTLNSVTAALMVDPGQLAGGDHTMFVSGNDAEAKAEVRRLLEDFGWRDVIDLGDITSARAMEMILPLWARLLAETDSPVINIKVVR